MLPTVNYGMKKEIFRLEQKFTTKRRKFSEAIGKKKQILRLRKLITNQSTSPVAKKNTHGIIS